MASLRANRLRPLLILGLFLAAWWLIPVGVRRFTRASFALFEAPGLISYSRAKDLQDFWSTRDHSADDLVAAGRDTQRQANDSNLQLEETEATRQENEHLSELLHLPPEPGFRYEVARVIARDENAWWQQITIRKGSRNGLAEGQGVIFAGGVVGRVKQVYNFTAIVELITSPSFRMAASIGPDSLPVIYQGVETKPFQNPQGEVDEVQLSVQLAPNQPLRLYSSRYGGEFPPGLFVGEIERLSPGSDGLFQMGTVKLDSRLLSLQEVAVLVQDDSIQPLPSTPAAQPSLMPSK